MPFTGGTGVSYPSALTEIGLAIETTKGTLPSEPLYMFPVMGPKYKPDQAYIPDETLQGVMAQVQDQVMGMRYDTHGWDAPPYLDSFPILLRGLLGSTDNKTAAGTATTLSSQATAGSVTISTAASIASGSYIQLGSAANGNLETHKTTGVSGSGPYTVTLATPTLYLQTSGSAVTPLTIHQFSLLNNANQGQPPSISIWDGNGEEWRTMTAGQLDELTIKGNATGLNSYTCSFFCNAAVENATAPSTSYTGVQTPAPWTTTLLLGGTEVQTVLEWEFDFKRQVKPIPALTGTQAYLQYLAAPILATGKITFVEQSGSPYLNDYLTGVRQSLDFTLFDMLSGFALNLHSTTGLFITGELDRGQPEIEVPVEFQLLPTTTDALAGGKSPVIATVANTVTTSY